MTDSRSTSYVEHVARLEERLSTDEALRRAVGGEFVAVGKLEYHLLRSRGLKDHHLVIDVGCGSGRLACQLAPFPEVRYIGCDVVPRLLDYARELCARPDWRFEHLRGATLPCGDDQADFVCFFSVFTHLHQEEIFRYFREAYRVLKPAGLMVCSFLEFRVPSHWATFIASVDHTRVDEHLNQFVDRDSLHTWAAAAGFNVLGIYGGDTDYIPLPEKITFENGAQATGMASLGQSLAVLQKRATNLDPATTSTRPTSSTRPSGLAQPEVVPAVVVDEMQEAGPAAADHPLPLTAPTSPLVNVSTRAHLSPGAAITTGFTISGNTPRRVLIRAIGPSLRLFGHPSPLEHPSLEIYAGDVRREVNSDGWGGDAHLAAAAVAVGAFALPAENKDVVLITVLPPGSYTAVVKGATAAEQGEVVVEVYLID